MEYSSTMYDWCVDYEKGVAVRLKAVRGYLSQMWGSHLLVRFLFT